MSLSKITLATALALGGVGSASAEALVSRFALQASADQPQPPALAPPSALHTPMAPAAAPASFLVEAVSRQLGETPAQRPSAAPTQRHAAPAWTLAANETGDDTDTMLADLDALGPVLISATDLALLDTRKNFSDTLAAPSRPAAGPAGRSAGPAWAGGLIDSAAAAAHSAARFATSLLPGSMQGLVKPGPAASHRQMDAWVLLAALTIAAAGLIGLLAITRLQRPRARARLAKR